MSARYAPIPNPSDNADPDRELNDAFGSEDGNDNENQPTSAVPLVHSSSPSQSNNREDNDLPTYDFERDYDHPPPGSPPSPSRFALPNEIGNSNGRLPTSPVVRVNQRPSNRPSFFRRTVGALLPQYYTQVPTSDDAPLRPIGGGIDNDGVFANVTAKPQRGRMVRTEDGQSILVPETTQTEPLPSYTEAQADAVPPYWETVVHAPPNPSGSNIFVDDLAPGSILIFAINALIAWFFQFIGFLLTYLLHTTHAAKFGSRAGLGLTLIQYGFYSRKMDRPPPPMETDESTLKSPAFDVYNITDLTMPSTAPMPDDRMGMSSKDWLSILFMTIGWFLLISSVIGYWRVKRWEASVRSSQAQAPVTSSPDQQERDRAARQQLHSVFSMPVDDSRVRFDEHGDMLVLPNQEALAEARLARDLRAAGLI
ncbi:hypothetical protein M378DRAFT_106192 [Amanita muscaria Koide BX008]|uniref:Metal homeostatis protein bsd2 n=1 Tax=Amanita muscaria (strain Koide BX008) TaxID=946122 RepID=A0A0C2TCI0_AMAMK|nr:hypothetical protein M378DRAFT_106192 [Amanita muscaria Koide BX008]